MTVEQIVEKYSTMLFRICLLILCSEADAKDVVQDTLVSFMENKKEFKDEEHEKAWLMRVARNRAMDRIRFQKRHPVVDIVTKKILFYCSSYFNNNCYWCTGLREGTINTERTNERSSTGKIR